MAFGFPDNRVVAYEFHGLLKHQILLDNLCAHQFTDLFGLGVIGFLEPLILGVYLVFADIKALKLCNFFKCEPEFDLRFSARAKL